MCVCISHCSSGGLLVSLYLVLFISHLHSVVQCLGLYDCADADLPSMHGKCQRGRSDKAVGFHQGQNPLWGRISQKACAHYFGYNADKREQKHIIVQLQAYYYHCNPTFPAYTSLEMDGCSSWWKVLTCLRLEMYRVMYSTVTGSSTVSLWLWHSTWALFITILASAVSPVNELIRHTCNYCNEKKKCICFSKWGEEQNTVAQKKAFKMK